MTQQTTYSGTEDLRARHPTLADKVGDGQIDLEAAIAEAIKRDSRPRSGYARAKSRLHKIYAQHDALKAEHEALQADVDRLLAEHRRIMEATKARGDSRLGWHESANTILAELEGNPDRRALQVMTASLAQLQSRLAAIVMRVTL